MHKVNFEYEVEVPANTTQDKPKVQDLNIAPGIITKIEIHFPAGCHGLVKVRLLHVWFQILPLSMGEWVAGDDETVEFILHYEIKKEPATLTLVAISPTTVYNHKIRVRITVLPKTIASWKPLYDLISKIARRIFGIRI